MPRSSVFSPLLIAAAALLTGAASEPDKPPSATLSEKVETRLVQLDVTVEGKGSETLELTAADFEVSVAGREITDLTADRLCPSALPEAERIATEPAPGPPTPVQPLPKTAPATFLFFFDQPHLTLEGRARGLDTARDLVRRLIRGGNQGMLVSSARSMRTVVPLTKDPKDLLGGLDRLEKDSTQLDAYASTELSRIEEVGEILRRTRSKDAACAVARVYKRDEWSQARTSLNRLGILLGALLESKPPKVAFYFADTLRQKAGLHYVLIPSGCDPGDGLIPEAAAEFDRAIDAAAEFGVHIFPVQAQGLTSESGGRFDDAEHGLQILAAETGGEAMIRGIPSARFAERVLQRVSCIYLLSFDPKDLPTDKPLAVTVRVKRRGLKARVQGRLVVQSETQRTTSRLLAAFAMPTGGSEFPVAVELIPIGFERKHYRALVQVKVPRGPLAGNEMDLGASLVGSAVREAFSARIKVGTPGVPFVLEKELELEPGPFEIVAVGHDLRNDEIGTGRAEGGWPDPRDAEVTVSPIALVQEQTAAFSRDGAARNFGAIALSETEVVAADRGTALVTVVCGAGKLNDTVRVLRTLSGETRIDFEAIELGAAQDPCLQVRDVIPANGMAPGGYRYELGVETADKKLVEVAREFVVGEKSRHSGRHGS